MQHNTPAFDALILAGGRSSRLGGTPKQDLVFEGTTLLDSALAAASGARRTVVVGPTPATLPPGVMACREQPEFAGPAAAIATGLQVLDREGGSSEYTLVLACDMPLVSGAVLELKAELSRTRGHQPDGIVACTDDTGGRSRMQPLAAFYRTAVLQKSAGELAARNELINGSVRALLASLDLQLVLVPRVSTADVDTWDDAAALGVAVGGEEGSGQGSGNDNAANDSGGMQ